MTYINCILKLTALPTAAHGKLPGAGRVSVLSVQVQAQPGWGWEPFCCFLEEKSMVALNTARKCPLRAARLRTTRLFSSWSTELHQDNSRAAERGWTFQCLGENLMGWEQEGILGKSGSYPSSNLIHLEQALSLHPTGILQSCQQGSSSAQSSQGVQSPSKPLEYLKQNTEVPLEGKFHSPHKFSSSSCYSTHFTEKKPDGPKMTISIHTHTYMNIYRHTHTHIYEYIYIQTQIHTWIHTHRGDVPKVLLALII